MIRTLALALVTGIVLAAGGCASTPQAELALVRGAKGARAVVIVLDASPGADALRQAATASLEAALALAATGSEPAATGIVATGPDGPIVLASLGDPVSPDAVARAAAFKGEPGLGRAARRALDAIVASEARPGSLVLLLSGEPEDKDSREVQRVSAALAQRSCRLLRVPLEAGARLAVQALARDAFGFMAADGAPASVTLGFPGGTLAAIFPRGQGIKLFDPKTTGKIDLPGAELVLYRPSWELALEPDAPPPIAALGEPVPISIVLSGKNAAAPGLLVSCVPGAGAPLALARTVVAARGSEPASVRFEGQAPAPLEEAERELSIEVSWKAGDARFTLARVFRYLARRRDGPAPPLVQVSPERLDLGVVPSESRVPAKLTLTGDPDRATRVTLDPLASVAPFSLVLGPGEVRSQTILVDPSKLASGERLTLHATIEGTSAALVRPRARGERERPGEPQGAAPPRLLHVALAATTRTVRLPAKLELAVESGSSARIVVPVGLDGGRFTARAVLEPEDAAIALAVSLDGDKLVLEASARSKVPAGPRTGRVELTLDGSSAPPLVRPLLLTVLPSHELALELDPPALALKGRYGWTEGRVHLASNLAADLSFVPSAFTSAGGARITPRRDIRVGPSDATWDARGLVAGEGRDLLVRVYLPSDLPAGTYVGSVALAVATPGGKLERPLPVTIEVER
jgi:hypothetical protein